MTNPRDIEVTAIAMHALLDVQMMHKKHPATFEAPDMDVLDVVLDEGMLTKICYGEERFWVEIIHIDTEDGFLWAQVKNNLLQPSLKWGDVIIVERKNLLCYPLHQVPDGWQATEVQVCIMAQDPDHEDVYIIREADERTRRGPISSFDVMLRLAAVNEPDVIEIDDWEFKSYEHATEWADALCDQFKFSDYETI